MKKGSKDDREQVALLREFRDSMLGLFEALEEEIDLDNETQVRLLQAKKVMNESNLNKLAQKTFRSE